MWELTNVLQSKLIRYMNREPRESEIILVTGIKIRFVSWHVFKVRKNYWIGPSFLYHNSVMYDASLSGHFINQRASSPQTQTHTCTCACMHTRTHIHAYIRTCVYARIYVHTEKLVHSKSVPASSASTISSIPLIECYSPFRLGASESYRGMSSNYGSRGQT